MIKILKITIILALLILSFHTFNTYASADEKKTSLANDDGNGVLALNYHRVRSGGILDSFLAMFSNSKELSTYSITKKEFEDQIKWLKSHDAHFLTEAEMLKYKEKGKFPKHSVWLSFDDMDNSIYKNAYPILKKYHIPATGFIITGKVGQNDYHNLNMVNLKHLKEMEKSGLWTFNSHTNSIHSLKHNHSELVADKSNDAVTKDIKKSRDYLKQHFNTPAQSMAYPYGQINDEKVKAIQKAGIKYGYTLEEKTIKPDQNNYYMPRILVSKDSFHRIVQKWKGFNHDK